jgi:DNA uptake protein ComE-like DNA-binding protein
MKLVRFALAGVAAGLMALPVAAQTTQTTPSKPTPAVTAAAPAKTAAAPLIDINSASPADLDALPGIGPARAAAIIKGRPYKGKDDLVNKHILTPGVYDGIKGKIIAKQS